MKRVRIDFNRSGIPRVVEVICDDANLQKLFEVLGDLEYTTQVLDSYNVTEDILIANVGEVE